MNFNLLLYKMFKRYYVKYYFLVSAYTLTSPKGLWLADSVNCYVEIMDLNKNFNNLQILVLSNFGQDDVQHVDSDLRH